MKKIIAAAACMWALSTNANEFSITAIHDLNVDKTGTRLSVSGPAIQNTIPRFSITTVPTEYTQASVGINGELGVIGTTSLNLASDFVYQYGQDQEGTGMRVGFNTATLINSSSEFVIGVEYFTPFSNQIDASEGVSIFAGINTSF